MEETEGLELIDYDDETGEELWMMRANAVLPYDTAFIVDSEGQEYGNDDWQGPQPKSFDEVREMECMRWFRLEDIYYIQW